MECSDSSIGAIAKFLHNQKLVSEKEEYALKALLEALAAGHTAHQQHAENSIYLRQNGSWSALAALAAAEEQIFSLMQHRASLRHKNPSNVSGKVNTLSQEQTAAAERALSAHIFLLEGGPGTGKTFTAAWIIQHSGAERWLALAPTGKAKAQLEASLSRYGLRNDWVMTVQGALSRHTHDGGVLDADFVLVDESSMLDSTLFFRLLKSLKITTRLLLLGDRHQLPPVGPGQPFADFCSFWQGTPHHCRLGESKRAESGSLLKAAEAVHNGTIGDLPIRGLTSSSQTSSDLLTFHQRPLPEDPHMLMQSLGERMVLGSLQEGPWGVSTLQESLKGCSVDPKHPWKPAPIMVLANVERADLWNGDLGWLCRPKDQAPFILMPERRNTRENRLKPSSEELSQGLRQVPLSSLPSWDYAWMLTVHKAQGSEFQNVAVILPPGSERFGRQLLYTAVTRSRKTLEIWSWAAIVQKIVQEGHERFSWLNRTLFPPQA